jgi:hypothetical protein
MTSGGLEFTLQEERIRPNPESILTLLPVIYKEWEQARTLPTTRLFQSSLLLCKRPSLTTSAASAAY